MQSILALLRRIGGRLTILLLLVAVLDRARQALRRRRGGDAGRHAVLPSLYDRHPEATAAARRRMGLRSVPLDRVIGTVRHPSQNTNDFLPLRPLRGHNWQARWQRITRATNRLDVLPPVDLLQAGEDYYVTDGHNRIGAALRAGALEIDADVTQLILPGITQPGQATLDVSSLAGSEAVRQAGQGRISRTVEQRTASDAVSRQDLLRDIEDRA